MSNRLADSQSLYLSQHSDNPVDWYPWGDDAIAAARASNKPILVSIGYSACHWCHVMAHESFENPATAAFMNDHFVNIKVDREERPDVDAVYMDAVQAMQNQGGWPLNVFLTPDLRPFFGGTYWPPEPRHGMPSWPQVLEAIASAWSDDPEKVQETATELVRIMERSNQVRASDAEITTELFEPALTVIKRQFDSVNGGFRGAPKFPTPANLELLLRLYFRTGDKQALDMVVLTLDKMASGGIYDQLGGGFHRYSVDATWTVPHFEKMLYDNAQLAMLYVHAWQATAYDRYRRIAEGTLDYLLRDMRSPDGGLFSAEDADSEGVEGRFYVWDLAQINTTLDKLGAAIFAKRYAVSDQGNFEGSTILTESASIESLAAEFAVSVEEVQTSLRHSSDSLMRIRGKRIRPGRDEKVLTDWNALAISAFIVAGRTFGRDDYVAAAHRIGDLLLASRDRNGHVPHVVRKEAKRPVVGFLDDYAFLLEGVLALFEGTGLGQWLEAAREIAHIMLSEFTDPDGGFFTTAASVAEALPVRPKGLFDSVTPSGNSSAAMGLLRLAAITGEDKWVTPALTTIRLVLHALPGNPLSFAHMIAGADFHLGPNREIVIAGNPSSANTRVLISTAFGCWLPNSVRVLVDTESPSASAADALPLIAGRTTIEGRSAAYVCERFVCKAPVTTPDALDALLRPPEG